MNPTPSKKNAPPKKPVAPSPPKTYQQLLEKWFLPFLFVVIGAIILWTFISAFRAR